MVQINCKTGMEASAETGVRCSVGENWRITVIMLWPKQKVVAEVEYQKVVEKLKEQS